MPAPDFKVNAYRYDPYKNFRFQVSWTPTVGGGSSTVVAGVSKVSGLNRTTEVVRFRAGNDPSVVRLSPGQTTYDPITLERGITYDTEFEQWANKIWSYTNSVSNPQQMVSLGDFRKELVITLFNEAGAAVLAWKVHRCWVSQFQALSELDGSGNAVAIQSIKIENEGWERDPSVTEQAETTYNQPSS